MLRKLYHSLIGTIYDPFMRKMEQQALGPKRQRLLQDLQGTVLEVGAGTGVNFRYYPKDVRVIAIEPSNAMLRQAQKKVPTYPNVVLLQAKVEDNALITPHMPEGGFDAIICSLVLCTIPDLEASFKYFKSWLKPGGQLLVLEHICAEEKWKCGLHTAVNPVWRGLAQGCNLNRHTDQLLKESGFEPIWEHHFKLGLRFYEAALTLPAK
jgi:ubiquinone/menaquinone biosynthesis C-methylase UbiE